MSQMIKEPIVAIMIPSGRTWEADMAMCVSAISTWSMSRGIRTIIVNEKSSMVSRARNSMVKRAIEAGATHLFWLDSDMTVPVDVIPMLLGREKDIVGAFYAKRVHPYTTLGVPLKAFDPHAAGVIPYWLLPGGCIMVKASVYQSIPEPWYFDVMRRPGEPLEALSALLADHYTLEPSPDVINSIAESKPVMDWLKRELEYNDERYQGNQIISEDYNFCRKAIRYGYGIYADLDLSFLIGHIGEQSFVLQRPPKPEENSSHS